MIKPAEAKAIVTDIVQILVTKRAYGASTAGKISHLIRLKQLGSMASPEKIVKELEDAVFQGFLLEKEDEISKLAEWLNFRWKNNDTFPVAHWGQL